MRRAECCWMTKSSGPLRASATAGAGSGVAARSASRNSLLTSLSLSLPLAMPDSKKLLAGASGYSFKEWKGSFLSGKDQARGDAPFYSAAAADGGDQQHLLPDAEDRGPGELGALDPESFRFAIKASRRITHMSRLKAESAADSVNFLYRNLAVLGAKRGPVLYQLPPFLKKDLPRLAVSGAPARGPPRLSSSATTAGSPRMSTTRSSAPARRCASPSARTTLRPAGRNGAVGLRPSAA